MSPLLFVICIEYLSRVLHKMSALDMFHFHLKCKAMRLTNMCFADDLILYLLQRWVCFHLVIAGSFQVVCKYIRVESQYTEVYNVCVWYANAGSSEDSTGIRF